LEFFTLANHDYTGLKNPNTANLTKLFVNLNLSLPYCYAPENNKNRPSNYSNVKKTDKPSEPKAAEGFY
jgi:hypothetical protein